MSSRRARFIGSIVVTFIFSTVVRHASAQPAPAEDTQIKDAPVEDAPAQDPQPQHTQSKPVAPPATGTKAQPETQAPSPRKPTAARPAEIRGRSIEAAAAVKKALANNPTLRASKLNINQADQEILIQEGRYPFIFQADAGFTRSEIPRLAANDSVTATPSRSYTLGTSLRRTFPTGTTGQIRLQGERFERDIVGLGAGSARSLGNGYGVSARATVTQPLLRGAGTTVNELDLRAARVNRTLSEKAYIRFKSQLVRDVLIAYWELWYATRAVRIERAALELAEQQLKDAQEQVRFGALAPASVYSFATRVAQLQEAIVGAEIQRQQRSLELAQLMGASDGGTQNWIAASEPQALGPAASRAQIEAALRSGSVELAELEAQAKLARTRAEVAGESNRPRLDLEGYLETQGVSEEVPRAAGRAAQLSWTTAHVGLVFELPLGNTRLDAERSSALLAVRIAESNLKAARDRIASQATLAVANERAARTRLQLAHRTLEVAQRSYQAERERFELGEVLPIQVLQAEEEMRRAQLSLARARVNAVQAGIDVKHLSGELVRRYG